MFHQYQQMAVFLTVQSLGIGLLMLPKLHTILDPARKQKTIMTSKTVKVECTLNSFIPEEPWQTQIMLLHIRAHYRQPMKYMCTDCSKTKLILWQITI